LFLQVEMPLISRTLLQLFEALLYGDVIVPARESLSMDSTAFGFQFELRVRFVAGLFNLALDVAANLTRKIVYFARVQFPISDIHAPNRGQECACTEDGPQRSVGVLSGPLSVFTTVPICMHASLSRRNLKSEKRRLMSHAGRHNPHHS
jgi:hypothetical protein